MKNKKGFTLIELLAIIVILAIIAVITVPIILNIIENSKKGAATDSAYGFKDAVNKAYVTKLSGDSDYSIADNTYTVNDLKTQIGLSLSGKEPASNSWVTIEENEVTEGCLQYGEFKVEFTDGKVSNTEKGECEESSSSSTTQYGYKTYDRVNNKETDMIISTTNPTGKNAYLKYALTNGVVAEGTVPESCIYSDTYGGELCLKNNEYETSSQKIKDYFGYKTTGDDAWTNTSNNTWKNPDQTLTCYVDASAISCFDSVVGAGGYISGYVYAIDESPFFRCIVYEDGSARFYEE